jgi:DNA-binding MarR family transcriptional regulator
MPASAPTPRTLAETRAWLSVVRAYNLCDAELSQRLAGLGLRTVEHEILANIHRQPGITQQDLSERCFVAKSGVSMTLGRMETNGWLRRDSDPGDGRIKRLSLSAAGVALAERALAIQAEIIATMMAPLSDAELAQVRETSEQIARQLAPMPVARKRSPGPRRQG